MEKIKLFCIPYAGGTAYSYMNFKEYLSEFEIIPVELKGRGRRFKEEFYESFNEAVDDIYDQIKDKISDCRYAILGHSMGSWIAYDLYYKILDNKNMLPIHMFFSGRESPNTIKSDCSIYDESDDVLIESLRKLGGMDEEIIKNTEIFGMFLNIIRADMKVLNDYLFKERSIKISTSVTILSGTNDESINYRNLHNWTKLMEGEVSIVKIEGSHFYLNENRKKFCEVIKRIGNGEEIYEGF